MRDHNNDSGREDGDGRLKVRRRPKRAGTSRVTAGSQRSATVNPRENGRGYRFENTSLSPLEIDRIWEAQAERAANRVADGKDAQALSSLPPRPADADSTAVDEFVPSGGQPLAENLRDHFEARFGHDLGGVRVHTGTTAERLTRSVDAQAYTAGEHIVVGQEHRDPNTTPGRHLLAHELAHTIQQRHATRPVIQRRRDDEPLVDEEDEFFEDAEYPGQVDAEYTFEPMDIQADLGDETDGVTADKGLDPTGDSYGEELSYNQRYGGPAFLLKDISDTVEGWFHAFGDRNRELTDAWGEYYAQQLIESESFWEQALFGTGLGATSLWKVLSPQSGDQAMFDAAVGIPLAVARPVAAAAPALAGAGRQAADGLWARIQRLHRDRHGGVGGGPRAARVENAGIKTTPHFRWNLDYRSASRGFSEQDALEAYRSGRLFFDESTGHYVRYSSRTNVTVVVDEPQGGTAITVFTRKKLKESWNSVRWRPGD